MVERQDPYGSFNFLVNLPDIAGDPALPAAGFSEVAGLDIDVDTIEYRNGNDRENRPRKIPGLARYGNITLKRGVIGDLEVWRWVRAAVSGSATRVDGSVVLLDEARSEVLRWRFVRGLPARLAGPTLSATKNEIAIETLEIAHEGLEIQD